MTTREDIRAWFRQSEEMGCDYMIIVCDTFDYQDYPVSCSRGDFWDKYREYDGRNMQRIMEVYDLHESWESQSEGIVFNMPPRE